MRVAQVEQVAVVALVIDRERHRVAHSRLEAAVLVGVGILVAAFAGVLFLVSFFLVSFFLAGVLLLIAALADPYR